jgi:hypothetical protein
VLLSGGEDLISRATAAMKPELRAHEIAVVVAESNNPLGA